MPFPFEHRYRPRDLAERFALWPNPRSEIVSAWFFCQNDGGVNQSSGFRPFSVVRTNALTSTSREVT